MLPCFSFDVRGKHLSEARHWSAPEVFGPRAHFSTSPPPASLLVRDVKRRDEGVYRCRVDFRNTQTTSFRYNLTVVGKTQRADIIFSKCILRVIVQLFMRKNVTNKLSFLLLWYILGFVRYISCAVSVYPIYSLIVFLTLTH